MKYELMGMKITHISIEKPVNIYGQWLTMVITGDGELGFDSGEGAYIIDP